MVGVINAHSTFGNNACNVAVASDMGSREERRDALIASASCSPQYIALRMSKNENGLCAPAPSRWPVSETEHDWHKSCHRQTAVLVLASVPAAHGMFASVDSIRLPLVLLSDTVSNSASLCRCPFQDTYEETSALN